MQYIKKFCELSIEDIALVGGKNASLGEMYQQLQKKDIAVPNGFATTSAAYNLYLDHNNLREKITHELEQLNINDVDALAISGAKIRQWIANGTMPQLLVDEIRRAYKELESEYEDNIDVAVRSSATAEDLPNASFAGQQESYLNIRGTQNLLTTCKQVYASLFTDRAISYRVHKGFIHMDVALSIGVQKMVRSDMQSSGVMFSIDTETGFKDAVFITAAYGLGENIVQGAVNPDEFYVFKPTLKGKNRPIIKRSLGEKAIKMIYTTDPRAAISTKNVKVAQKDRQRFCISDDEVLTLAKYAKTIEKHYGKPMDIEWAKDGKDGKLYIVQARPETVQSMADLNFKEIYNLKQSSPILISGKSVGQKIASGKARVIMEAKDMNKLKKGEVLVTDITDPDWEPVMKIASAIITNRGGRTCHAAIIARELGIPAIVGCYDATGVIKDKAKVTVDCSQGDSGYVYEGALEYAVKKIALKSDTKPKTKIMLNLANPQQAFELSRLPCEGVGLARLEFIINNTIKVHPKALLEFATLDAQTKKQISDIIVGYGDAKNFFVQKMAEGVASIAAAFYPKPVIVRLSDFKSNEYAKLIGGSGFEPKEENPMIGFRGAYRYASKDFTQAFFLECQALKIVREQMGLKNVELMVPFVRSVDEGVNVLNMMQKNGLQRGKKGLKVHMMCEIPANALLADQFLDHFDGFSIGSNDLTQLTVGVDRDSGIVTGVDERNEAVLMLMEMAIKACQKRGKYIGICGQAPSDFPEITKWLVEKGIKSISLNPDSVIAMRQVVLEVEQALQK